MDSILWLTILQVGTAFCSIDVPSNRTIWQQFFLYLLSCKVKINFRQVNNRFTTIFNLRLSLRNIHTCSGFIFWKPNFSIHIDSASSAAGSTRFCTFKNANNFSMQENSNWKYPWESKQIKIHNYITMAEKYNI